MLNQDKNTFAEWLKSRPEGEKASAGDPECCWIAIWFKSQKEVPVWGVFPEHYRERLEDAPGKASQELLLEDPEDEDFNEERDRIPLEEWVCEFANRIDWLYEEIFSSSLVSREQALEVLENLE